MGLPGDKNDPFKAPDPGKKQLAQVMKIYNQAKGQQANDLAASAAQGQAGVQSVKQGYAAAKKNIGGLGLATKDQIIKQGLATQAGVGASQVGRGFGNASTTGLAGRGARAATSQQLAQLDESIAQLMAGLNTGEGHAVGGAQMSLAQLLGGQSGQKTELASQIAQALAGVQHSDPNAWMGNLTKLGTAALLCDERSKLRFELVDAVDGIPVYEFEYRKRWAPYFPGRYRGVKAQDVRHIDGAVHELGNGYLVVDYSKLPKRAHMRRVA